jgi:hypothetical protein
LKKFLAWWAIRDDWWDLQTLCRGDTAQARDGPGCNIFGAIEESAEEEGVFERLCIIRHIILGLIKIRQWLSDVCGGIDALLVWPQSFGQTLTHLLGDSLDVLSGAPCAHDRIVSLLPELTRPKIGDQNVGLARSVTESRWSLPRILHCLLNLRGRRFIAQQHSGYASSLLEAKDYFVCVVRRAGDCIERTVQPSCDLLHLKILAMAWNQNRVTSPIDWRSFATQDVLHSSWAVKLEATRQDGPTFDSSVIPSTMNYMPYLDETETLQRGIVPLKSIAEDGSDDVTVRTLAQAAVVSYETTSIANHVQSEVARLFPATLGVPV